MPPLSSESETRITRAVAGIGDPGKGQRMIADGAGCDNVGNNPHGIAGKGVVRTASSDITIKDPGRAGWIIIGLGVESGEGKQTKTEDGKRS